VQPRATSTLWNRRSSTAAATRRKRELFQFATEQHVAFGVGNHGGRLVDLGAELFGQLAGRKVVGATNSSRRAPPQLGSRGEAAFTPALKEKMRSCGLPSPQASCFAA